MPRLRDLDLARHLADPARKQEFVTPMFELVAPRYDAFTRVFSYGLDARWKRVLMDEVVRHAPPRPRVLDVACGTGDLARAAAARLPGSRVIGIDLSARMLDLARAHAGTESTIQFRVGDLAATGETAASVDVVMAGYAFRNAPDWHAALRESARVLRPGGVLAVLDFFLPEFAPWRTVFLAYLRVAGSIVGWLWHREPIAYGYIAPSIAAFVSVRGFAEDLGSAGFEAVAERRWLGGGVAMLIARRR